MGRTGELGRQILDVSKKEKLLLGAGGGGCGDIRHELQGRGIVARCLAVGRDSSLSTGRKPAGRRAGQWAWEDFEVSVGSQQSAF